MAIENNDLLVVQKVDTGNIAKVRVSDIKPDLPPTLWTEDSGNLYPTTLTNKVGIGTDSPGSTLDVVSNTQNVAQFVGASACRIDLAASGTGTDNYLQLMSDKALRWVGSGTEKVRIDPVGNVGIGTNSPAGNLSVDGSAGTNPGDNPLIHFSVSDAPIWAFRSTDGNTHLGIDGKFGGTWKNHVAIDRNTGNVGIGTDSPDANLHIK